MTQSPTHAGPAAAISHAVPRPAWVRFDRHELAGSFGDIGTDLPLLIGMILAAGLDAASVFVVFGALQVITGLVYGLPMPMQPLKAMAVLVISQGIGGGTLYGAGLAIGALMLALSLSGALTLLARAIPRCAVRGVQFGLGLSLMTLALRQYVPAQGAAGWGLAAAGFVLMLALWGSRRAPAGLLLIGLYKWLDKIIKVVVVVLSLTTFIATALVLPQLPFDSVRILPEADWITTAVVAVAICGLIG
ncbi:MAG TPA: putative sulfate/molybdate transporter, partial [Phycisphaerae bacterium]|nr:putative sulfate/molybdate transporter [Phycisphaerae bacterium]